MVESKTQRKSLALLITGALLLAWLAHVIGGLLGLIVGGVALSIGTITAKRIAPNLTRGKTWPVMGLLAAIYGVIEPLATGGPLWFIVTCLAIAGYFTWRIAKSAPVAEANSSEPSE